MARSRVLKLGSVSRTWRKEHLRSATLKERSGLDTNHTARASGIDGSTSILERRLCEGAHLQHVSYDVTQNKQSKSNRRLARSPPIVYACVEKLFPRMFHVSARFLGEPLTLTVAVRLIEPAELSCMHILSVKLLSR